ncbi:hypothetical protein Droror1_Dr00022442 [Drosera rotundifolia]
MNLHITHQHSNNTIAKEQNNNTQEKMVNLTSSTSFSRAYTLLNQYLKEKRSYDNTIPSPTRSNNINTVVSNKDDNSFGCIKGTTMNLFPQETGFGSKGQHHQVSTESAGGQQMSIFYGGKVIVFDDLPPEKAKEIMKIASAASAASKPPASDVGDCSMVPDKMMLKGSDLPIPRKGSLQRFFEKRKDRISARAAPYTLNRCESSEKLSAKGSDESKSWLGLAAPQPTVELQLL